LLSDIFLDQSDIKNVISTLKLVLRTNLGIRNGVLNEIQQIKHRKMAKNTAVFF